MLLINKLHRPFSMSLVPTSKQLYVVCRVQAFCAALSLSRKDVQCLNITRGWELKMVMN